VEKWEERERGANISFQDNPTRYASSERQRCPLTLAMDYLFFREAFCDISR
jgi:hypothetical protein